MSASKEIDKSDFMSIESTLHLSKVSIFNVSNKFLEKKNLQLYYELIIHTLSFSVTQYLRKNSDNMFILTCTYSNV